jgi:hypothetical protein
MLRLLPLLLLVTSCIPVYVPNARHAPMFSKRGQFQGTIQMGNGFDVQGAFSVSDNVALMGNYSYVSQSSASDQSGSYSRHSFVEGGLGFFKNNDRITLELFAGYGKGQGTSSESNWLFSSQYGGTGKYDRYFIQPAIGVQVGRFQYAFVSRISYVDFTEFTYGTTSYVDNHEGIYFLEPAFIGKIDMKKEPLFATWQLGYSHSSNRNYYDFGRLQISVGFGIKLPRGPKPDVNQ